MALGDLAAIRSLRAPGLRSWRAVVVACVVALPLCACSGNALVGAWVGSASPLTLTLTLAGDGTGTLVGDGSGGVGCTGTITWAGGTWHASSSTITFDGHPTCSGSVSCGTTAVDCTTRGIDLVETETCQYEILHSSGASGGAGDELDLTCPGRTDLTLGRQM